MNGLFESLSAYMMIGLIAGLVLFLLLWRKWDVPGYMKERFMLKTRTRAAVFIIVCGMVLALGVSIVLELFGVPLEAAQIGVGLAIAFNCSLIPGLLRPAGSYRQTAAGAPKSDANRNKRSENSRTRRSKG